MGNRHWEIVSRKKGHQWTFFALIKPKSSFLISDRLSRGALEMKFSLSARSNCVSLLGLIPKRHTRIEQIPYRGFWQPLPQCLTVLKQQTAVSGLLIRIVSLRQCVGQFINLFDKVHCLLPNNKIFVSSRFIVGHDVVLQSIL
jgi:hypothetical protein